MQRILRRALPLLAAACGFGGLVLFVNPGSIVSSLGRFDAWILVPVVALTLLFYVLQGFRWHLLLRQVGVKTSARDSQLMNLAGQTLSAVIPLGDLTRALLVSRSSGVAFGAAAATVTVQELSFMVLVVVAASPGLTRLPNGPVWMVALLGVIAAVIAVLTVPRLFAPVRRAVAATPGLRRLLGDVETLQREARRLLARPDVLAGAVLDLGRVIVATVTLLLVLRGLHVSTLGWWDVALVFATSCIGGALSLLPGGIGANEATVVGVLVLLGVNPAAAAAAAIIQRVSLTLVPSVSGALALLALRRRRLATAGDLFARRPVGDLDPRFAAAPA